MAYLKLNQHWHLVSQLSSPRYSFVFSLLVRNQCLYCILTLCMLFQAVPTIRQRDGRSRITGPTVVQLATTHSALIVHLVHRDGSFSDACQGTLQPLLEDASIAKAGCGIDMDMVELQSVWNTELHASCRFDVGRAVNGCHNVAGLKTLAARILHLSLPKSTRIAMSDWSEFPLSTKQVSYAAHDAWVAAAVCETLAQQEPETYQTKHLVEALRDQVPIPVLHGRFVKRTKAKAILRELLGNDDKTNQLQTLPSWKARLVCDLNAIIRANKHIQSDDPEFHSMANSWRNNTFFSNSSA